MGESQEQHEEAPIRLGRAPRGFTGRITAISPDEAGSSLAFEELENRLLEFGFVEGAQIEVLHEGAIRHDPIAVRLDDMRIALRRRDAEDIWVLMEPGKSKA